ncbi:hypothetical protein PT974_09966 [Cladobotryum mycophilum]|uniref:Uncharacterized protein n=1 Tax=Cladobotryum mycophilum TaxID=491253 RepID=A0ABR0S8Q3_9HYPO
MSQSNDIFATPTPPTVVASPPALADTPIPGFSHRLWTANCALLLQANQALGGKNLGASTDINVRLLAIRASVEIPSICFDLEFPVDATKDEEEGRGVHDRHARAVAVAPNFRLRVKLPIGQFVHFAEHANRSLIDRFPGAKRLTHLTICLKGKVNIFNWGMPYSNPGHECDAWLNDSAPVIGEKTLLDILQQETLCFAVEERDQVLVKQLDAAGLPAPWSYPYGASKGALFPAAWGFEDDKAHLTVLTQSVAQDIIWVSEAAKAIREQQFPVYFVDASQDGSRYYVVMPLPKEFRDRFESPWRRLAKGNPLRLELWEQEGDEETAVPWEAKIMDHPEGIDAFKVDHPLEKETDLVLYVRRPDRTKPGSNFDVLTFANRSDANQALEENSGR